MTWVILSVINVMVGNGFRFVHALQISKEIPNLPTHVRQVVSTVESRQINKHLFIRSHFILPFEAMRKHTNTYKHILTRHTQAKPPSPPNRLGSFSLTDIN